ncbi:MAG: C39 family peptidase [Microcoleaceae cyanobacterium]
MKLTEFANANLRYDSSAIAKDPELSKEVQDILIDDLHLLVEPEEPFGRRAIAALTRFQKQNDCHEPQFLGPETAAKLLEAKDMGSRAPVSVITLEVLQNTVLKLRPLAAGDLEDKEKLNLAVGETLELTYVEPARKHLVLTLTKEMYGSAVWYVFGEHVKVSGGEAMEAVAPPSEQKPEVSLDTPPNQVKLDVPYKSQRDNLNNPDGSCNVTSIAMCLAFLGVPQRRPEIQFEDELYEYALDNNLSRHSPGDLARIVEAYGAKDVLDLYATMDAVKSWLAAGNPVVTHGYFTTFGHIIAVVGYDEKGLIVHDPYGEWYSSGYDRNAPGQTDTKGKFLNYSYGLIKATCATDNQFWVHFISK